MKRKIEWLTNPFRYVAGWQSIVIGAAICVATALIGSLNGVFFPGILSLKVGGQLTFVALLVQLAVNWAVLGMLLFCAGLLFSATKPRLIDVMGTQGMARFPYLPVSLWGFSGALNQFGDFVMYKNMGVGQPVEMGAGEMAWAVFQLLTIMGATVWMVALMYRAFAVSVNMKGAKAVWVFTVTLLLAAAVTAVLGAI